MKMSSRSGPPTLDNEIDEQRSNFYRGSTLQRYARRSERVEKKINFNNLFLIRSTELNQTNVVFS